MSASASPIDIEKKDGSHSLVVPCIRDADALDFARVHGVLRRPDPQGEVEQARGRRLRRGHRHAHQPGHDRHRAIGPPPHARPGLDHRRRDARLPDRVRRSRSPHHRRARGVEGDHPLLHVRPPDHPGRRVRPDAQEGPPVPARRGRVLRGDLPLGRRSVRGREVAPGRQRQRPRVRPGRQADAGGDPDQHASGAGPPHRRSRSARRQAARDARRARPADLRPEHLGPRPRVPHRRRRRSSTPWSAESAGCSSARSSTCCATRTAGRSASSTCTSRNRPRSGGSRSRSRGPIRSSRSRTSATSSRS